MATFGRIVLGCIIVVLVGTGLYYALTNTVWNFRGATPSAASVEATSTPFDEVGTIIYYIQQGVEVPYLVYASRGATFSKALQFNGESICVTSVQAPCPAATDALKARYGSGPVEVRGTPNEESLLVTRISRASL